MNRAGVLVVDDSAVTGETLCELFRARGWRADYAANAESALARATVHPYAAFVIDHRMPGRSGLELIALLRLSAEFASAPVVLLTAAPECEHEALRAALEALRPATLLGKPAEADAIAREILRLRVTGGGEP